jgi:hypothetical protein
VAASLRHNYERRAARTSRNIIITENVDEGSSHSFSIAFLSLTCCEVVMVEMVCQEEMVRMESQDLKENGDHLDLKDSQDLGVLG